MMNIVAVEERSEWAEEGWYHPDDPAHLQEAFAEFCTEVQDLLRSVDNCFLWGLFRHPVARRWTAPGMALVGDAAHPMLPFLAQGASMAIEDGWVLADALMRHDSEEAAWSDYVARRRDRVRRVADAAEANARNYHLSNPLVRMVAHSGLRVLGRVSPNTMVRRFDWLYGADVTAG